MPSTTFFTHKISKLDRFLYCIRDSYYILYKRIRLYDISYINYTYNC